MHLGMSSSASPGSSGSAGQEPGRPSIPAPTGGRISSENGNQKILKENSENRVYANPPAGVKDVNLAAARDVTLNLPAGTSSNGAARVLGSWADCIEDLSPGAEDDFTVVKTKKRRRESSNSPTAAAPSSNSGGARSSRRLHSSARSVPRAQEIPTTRTHITEARARQASSSEEHCVYLEHGPELQPFHYLRALDRLLGGTAGIIQISKVNGHQLLGLANRGLAERLINNGLEVEGTLLRAFPFRKRAERITGHRRANCPLLAGLANNTRTAPPTTPAGVPPPTTPAPPQRSAAQHPAPTPSNPAMEVCSAPPVARAALHSSAPRPSPPAAPAFPMEETPPAPPPVTPAPSLQTPGSREPAAPTPDVEMSIVEETLASFTSSAKNATRGRPRCVHRGAPQRVLRWDGRPWSWAGGGPGPPLLEDQGAEEGTPPVASAVRRPRRPDRANPGPETRSSQQPVQSPRTTDSAVITALSPFGRVTSIAPKQMKAGPYVYVDGRRDVFITLHEGITIERLPTRLDINIKGQAWPAYLSSGIRCSRCHGQGYRRAICPLLAGLANNTRMAPPTTPAGVPPPTTSAPPQRAPPMARTVLHPSAPRPSPPAAPALPMEETPSAPPPVIPAPSLQAPEGSVGPRSANSQHPEPPPARPDFVAPRDPLPAQKTLGPAAPTPDVEMSIVEETSASSTPLAKNATRVDLDAFIERHPSVSFAGTDALGLGREEVLDLLSSRTKAQRKGPLLSPLQCDALAGLIGQILDLGPEQPATFTKSSDKSRLSSGQHQQCLQHPYCLRLGLLSQHHPLSTGKRRTPHVYTRPCGHASRELLSFSPLASGGMSLEATNLVWAGSPHRAEHEPARLSSESEAVADLSAENLLQGENSRMADASANYANLPIDRSHANFAAACIADVTPSTSGALAAATNWAEQMEAAESGQDGFTEIKHKRRRRDSPGRPVEQRSSGIATSGRTGANPRSRPPAGRATEVQVIRATRADIADARARQRSSTEDNCVFVEHCPDFGSTHYLQAVEELVGGAGNVLQVMKMDGHMLVGLSTKALAERIIRDGLDIGHTHLRAFPFKKRAERITVGNLPFFVDDAAVIEALKPYGDVTSIVPIWLRAGRYTFTDGRREAFILLKEGIALEKIPTRVVIRNKGNVLPAFISYGVKCSRCGRQGHRRANCPINPRRASNDGQPQPATHPPRASSTVSRQPNPPTPAAPALPMEETPSAPPPVIPAPSLQAPEGPVGLRSANSHPEPPPARPDFVAPHDPLPAQKTLGPAAPTPDVEMYIVEETSAFSTSSAKNATRFDLDAFIERHPTVSFAGTDALGLGREEVLDLLSSRTKAQRNGPLLSPPQCDALAGLIRQILDLRPGAATNIYKVLGQVKAELRTTPAAVPPSPPLPAPRPSEPVPLTSHGKQLSPASRTPPLPAPTEMEEDAPITEEERCAPPPPAPRLAGPIPPVPHGDTTTPPTPLGKETTLAMAAPPPPLSDQLIKADLDRECLGQIRDLLEELNYQHALRPLIKKGIDLDNIAFAI
ncbi:hypothetical protein LAZ67_14000235, partial [Cordylochernes scorpioides]